MPAAGATAGSGPMSPPRFVGPIVPNPRAGVFQGEQTAAARTRSRNPAQLFTPAFLIPVRRPRAGRTPPRGPLLRPTFSYAARPPRTAPPRSPALLQPPVPDQSRALPNPAHSHLPLQPPPPPRTFLATPPPDTPSP